MQNKPLSRPQGVGGGKLHGSGGYVSSHASGSSASGSYGHSEIVQIQPQHLKLQLRPRK